MASSSKTLFCTLDTAHSSSKSRLIGFLHNFFQNITYIILMLDLGQLKSLKYFNNIRWREESSYLLTIICPSVRDRDITKKKTKKYNLKQISTKFTVKEWPYALVPAGTCKEVDQIFVFTIDSIYILYYM